MYRPLLVLLGLLAAPVARAENWPRWRGPGGNGVSAEKPLPLHWDTTRNVLWKTRIPGEGASAPVVWGERVFLTAAEGQGTRRLVYALDRASGKVLWSRAVRDDDPERTSAVTGHAAATPATDGRRVVAAFGNAGVVCYDPGGQLLWHRRLGTFDTELGLASSPVLDGDHVFLVCDHDGDRFTSFDSFLVALDARTGKDLWRAGRRGLGRSWCTPILVPGAKGRAELIVSGQEAVRAYDPHTGRLLWQAPGLTGWVAPSPVFADGLVFATSGKNGPTLALRPGPRAAADRVVWQERTGGPYVCSPLAYGGCLYVPHETGLLTCRDLRGGTRHYRARLAGKFTASPVAGDGKVYWTNEDGTTFVLRAGPKFEVLARNQLAEMCRASPAVSGRVLFLRTEHHLYAVAAGKKHGAARPITPRTAPTSRSKSAPARCRGGRCRRRAATRAAAPRTAAGIPS